MNASQQDAALLVNTKLAEYDCAWCGAKRGKDVHSAACPVGERAQHIQKIGGVPWPKGKPMLSRSDFRSTRDYRKYVRRRQPGFEAEAARKRQAAIDAWWARVVEYEMEHM